MNVFRFVPGYERYIFESGKEPLFLLLSAFLVAFFLTRLYTRLARQRGWGSGAVGGVHLHHAVPGVILMVAGGLLFAAILPGERSVSAGLVAILFGIGTALVLDEFALLLHLEDVYWSERGRASVEAAILAVAVMGLMLVSGISVGSEAGEIALNLSAFVAYDIAFAVVAFLKGKFVLGTLGIFLAPIAWVAAIRLAKPYSPWAHWFYDPTRGRPIRQPKRARKLQRAKDRFEHGRLGRLERRLVDAIGGSPNATTPDPMG